MKTNLYLTGFMGAGKSTAGALLGTLCGREHFDTDDAVEAREHMGIPDIFKIHGEEYFREAETALLRETARRTNLIVSCGGGAPLREENVRLMKESGVIVLLTAEPETISRRLLAAYRRPLLGDIENIRFISGLLAAREEAYRKAADLIVRTDEKTPEEVCREILSGLPQFSLRET